MVYRNKRAMGNRPISDESDEWEITVGCWGGGGSSSLHRLMTGNHEDQLENCKGPPNKFRMRPTILEHSCEAILEAAAQE